MDLDELINKLRTTSNNLVLMVGVPLSGKSTLVNNIKNYVDIIISRDDIVLEMGQGLSYSDAFREVNQRKVSKELNNRILDASKSNNNIIIDMTNRNARSRKKFLDLFKNHTKIAYVAPEVSREVLLKRNEDRYNTEGKFIPIKVIDDFIMTYEPPIINEGFDVIIYV